MSEENKSKAAHRKLWAMNCILCGAEVFDLLIADKEEEAEEKIRNLTSEFEPNDIKYLMFRLKQLHP